MPRWICPAKVVLYLIETLSVDLQGTIASELSPLSSTSMRGGRELSDSLFPFSSQFLLILVPLVLIIALILLIVWCRKCAASNSSIE
jgi:hypothetical protein